MRRRVIIDWSNNIHLFRSLPHRNGRIARRTPIKNQRENKKERTKLWENESRSAAACDRHDVTWRETCLACHSHTKIQWFGCVRERAKDFQFTFWFSLRKFYNFTHAQCFRRLSLTRCEMNLCMDRAVHKVLSAFLKTTMKKIFEIEVCR